MEQEIFNLYDEIKKCINIIGNSSDNFEFQKENSDKLFRLKLQMQKLEKDLYKYKNADICGTDIDLYLTNIHNLKDNEIEKLNYVITLHDTKQIIGNIEVRLVLDDENRSLGNIGASIDPIYRGKRYSKQAFELLKDTLINYGLVEPIFTVRENNESSIKSLANIGAIMIGEDYDDEGKYFLFKFNLIENVKEK